ncbi:hypothetical protein EMPS_02667 [Entomortierella parvispora]|uniref:C2H2-type domain-containing protein n=1 Tax=Entomortierella parvispora TaxID=205924 RepID=A0A9P3H5W3_9FUNG|nr:hypothetical protein EMPS_02667 [Entomortierella parvispora]
MQVQSTSPYNYSTAQHPYNPNMFASTSTSAPQQYIAEQQPQQQQQQQDQGSEDMFLALERLLMGISPFPPTLPTLAKPTCPSLDDQLLAQIASPNVVPSIILNEQSLDLLNQYYQNQDNSTNNNNQFQQYSEPSDCSSSARSVSPPSSPFSYAAASPSMPLLDQSNNWMVAQQQQQQQQQAQQDWDFSLFDPLSLPLNVPSGLDYYLAAPEATMAVQPVQQSSTLKQQSTKKHAHHRRSSSACSALSAYESTAQREHRASSISSVGSVASSTTTTTGGRTVKSYACNICTKPFPTRTQLKSHMAIHTDAFPFPCQFAGCELHFKRKHDLRRHVDAKHALVKKYICTGGCGEGFGRRDQMVRHLRRGTCGQTGFQTD